MPSLVFVAHNTCIEIYHKYCVEPKNIENAVMYSQHIKLTCTESIECIPAPLEIFSKTNELVTIDGIRSVQIQRAYTIENKHKKDGENIIPSRYNYSANYKKYISIADNNLILWPHGEEGCTTLADNLL